MLRALLAAAALAAVLGLARGAPVASGDEGEGSVQEHLSARSGHADGVPVALAAGAEGSIWYADSGGVIARMTTAGAITGEFKLPAGSAAGEPAESQPQGVVLGPDGNIWFTDAGADAEGRRFVGRIDASGKVVEFKLPTAHRAPGQIVDGPDGDLWFTESPAPAGGSSEAPGSAVGRITTNGSITEFTTSASGPPPPPPALPPEIAWPQGIAAGADGNLWVTDWPTLYGAIDRITPSGVIYSWNVAAAGELGMPKAIVRGADGNVWFADSGLRVAGRVTPQGEISYFPLPGTSSSPAGMTLGPDGELWLGENSEANGLVRIAPDGSSTVFTPVSPSGGAPEALALGPEGDIWFTEPRREVLGRFVVPRAPVVVAAPQVSGAAVQGQLLAVSSGAWMHDTLSFSYQWQSCNAEGGECHSLVGETASEHLLTAADVGHRLRAVVSAANAGGSGSEASDLSAVVAAAPVIDKPPPVIRKAPGGQLKVVGATLDWRFAWSRRYTYVRALVVRHLPAGALVELGCSGHGCPLTRRRLRAEDAPACRARARRCPRKAPGAVRGTLDLTPLLRGRRLRVGTRVSVTVTKPGWVGKSFAFTTRAGRAPAVEIQCLASVTEDVGGGC